MSHDRASWLELPVEVPDEMKGLFRKVESVLGFVPNVFVGYTIRPTHFKHWFGHFRELMFGESELTRAEREMICMVVSAENKCIYCLVAHGADLREATGDPILSDRIAFDYRRANLDDRTLAVLDYALKITQSPVDCDEADIEKLRGFGFSDAGIFDIAEVASMFNFTNRLASASGMLPNVQYHSMYR